MKNSFTFSGDIQKRYEKVIKYDNDEIDNPISYHPNKLHYLDRLYTIINIIEKNFSNRQETTIAEIGCAQANTSLLLAEKGYNVIAIDIDNYFIEYSKQKYEKGNISYYTENIEATILQKTSLDVIILGELVEHMAYPEKVINEIKKYLKKTGIIIITTPNGSRLKNKLPNFSNFLQIEKRKELESRQFGPDGSDHLFLFTLKELRYLTPKEMVISKKGYCGGTLIYLLIYKIFKDSLKFVATESIYKSFSLLSKIPLINKATFNNLYAVLSFK